MNPIFHPIHQHILLKAKVKKVMSDPEEAKKMLKELVGLLKMRALAEPQAVYSDVLGNEGLTGIILLDTSHIAFHIWDTTQLLMMDVYSCKNFDNQFILNFIETKFGGFEEFEGVTFNREIFTFEKINF